MVTYKFENGTFQACKMVTYKRENGTLQACKIATYKVEMVPYKLVKWQPFKLCIKR